MSYNNVAKKYTMASHNTSKVKQIIMLYDGMIKLLNNAKLASEHKDLQTKYNMIDRTLKVVTGLRASLDFNVGGNIAHILSEYYETIYRKLMNLHMNYDVKLCNSIIEMISIMKSAWVDIDESQTDSADLIAIPLDNASLNNLYISI